MSFTNIKKAANEAKLMIATIAFIVTSLIGGYKIISEYFVTVAYAEDMIADVNKQIDELKQQTKTNKKILIEMRLIRLETKIQRGEKLTPTEKRVYDKLKESYTRDEL